MEKQYFWTADCNKNLEYINNENEIPDILTNKLKTKFINYRVKTTK